MNKGAVEKSNWVSLIPSYPLLLLPIENSSPEFERMSVWACPQETFLIRISKLRLFGMLIKFYLSWLFESFPWPSYPSKSHPYEKNSV
jgi:hypothetical protein